MPNPSGSNGGLHVPGPEYGDVKRQATLTREAPISGSPVSTAATEAPRRAKRAATRTRQPQAPASPAAAGVVPPVELPSYTQQLAALAGSLADLPGAGPNVMWLAQTARQAGPPLG